MMEGMGKRKDFKWYNYNRILSQNSMWTLVVGPRGNGKTFGAKVRALKAATRHGRMFIYLRRYKEELTLAKETFFTDIEAAGLFEEWDFRVVGRVAQMSHVELRDDKKRVWHDIGYFVSLSTAQSYKSVSFANVDTIIFDEFILEKGHQRYLVNEMNVFKNFYSTVDRNQDRVKVFFLANAVSIMNPYFIDLKITPSGNDELGRIGRMSDGTYYVSYHFIKDADYVDQVTDTKFGQFNSGTQFEAFANKSEFSDNHSALVEFKPPEAFYWMTLETENGTFAVWCAHDPRRYYVTHKLPQQQVVMVLDLARVTEDNYFLPYSSKQLQVLRSCYYGGNVRFESAEAREAFRQIFKR